MAKLSAHGVEIARLDTTEAVAHNYSLQDDRPGSRTRTIYSFRSDGHILRRLVSLDLHGPGDHADHGWTLYRAIRKNGKLVKDRDSLLTWANKFAHAAHAMADEGKLVDVKFTSSRGLR